MKVRVWSSFASNNSGSYSLVGSFKDGAVAASVAAELARLCAEHDAWLDAPGETPSPLDTFITAHGLWKLPEDQSWPEHGPAPSVAAVGHQVLVHVPYTVSMPPTLGQLIYARGGRVELELDHSHNPVVAEVGMWWPYQLDKEAKAASIALVLRELADSSELRALLSAPRAEDTTTAELLAWHQSDNWLESPITVGAVFGEQLIEGVRALAALAAKHGGGHHLRLYEAFRNDDPLAHLR